MEQMAKSTLAALAEEAVVQALYNTGWGFYYLAHQDYVGATDSFTAAAEFGAVAAAAAVAGSFIPSGTSSSTASSNSTTPASPASPAQTPQQQPVQTTNTVRLAGGGLVDKITPAIIGDSPSGGDASEAVIPLEDNRAMRRISTAIIQQMGPVFGSLAIGALAQSGILAPPAKSPAQPTQPAKGTPSSQESGASSQPSAVSSPVSSGGLSKRAQMVHDYITQAFSPGFMERANESYQRAQSAIQRQQESEQQKKAVSGEVLPKESGGTGDTHNHFNITVQGMVSPDNLTKVMREMTRQATKGKGRLKSNIAFNLNKRG
jgi:hypothetical protein